MNITVFGTGYVGLVQGAVLSEVGHNVICVDVDAKKVEGLKNGVIPIYEPGLEPIVKSNFEAGRLNFTTDAKSAVEHANVLFIAVGTPPDEDGSADLKYVLAVAETIATHMTREAVIVTKSTVPVGTADKVKARVQQTLDGAGKSLDYHVVSNPEFLKEGAAVNDCMRPDRIIIGTDSELAEKRLRKLYAPFNRNHDRVIVMDIRSAELTKYAANCMLATKISFMNEMANLAERFGADIENVRKGIGSDPRIGYHFIYPGCGYGGSCFPKDVQALVRSANQVGYNASILEAVEAVNYRQKEKLFSYINAHFNGELAGKTVALWGLSFKPNTDDMREASSRVLMEQLWAAGAKVQAFDPEAMEETQRIYGSRDDLILCGTKEAALNDADMLVICTEWKTFRVPDFDLLKNKLSSAVIFDGRNLFEPEEMAERGFAYYAIGRGLSVKAFN
ncbi:UDP-glucose/GDP-mannose dehydrogenase family protein [Bowmanella sp. JS7-9]|uniref:UDP-glucose 6-dehydrogenase n=1 Tax=Pseudobowmanella zhangzhouensis TaxID=1537679 RepID=A0ABW1XK21_9ALTE|nr:UDP-glucose/GDP-mannose dehydrogenase family protein [Bowmanella sp. JS7-9]TBX25658.1 UDP-glucose 6-dehydrogenase [Bowmanella sp. JS7-9]